MIGTAKVKIELSNGGRRLFNFNVEGDESKDIENKVEQFAKMKANKHRVERTLSWEVKLEDRITFVGFIPYNAK
jgi:hypothetical protein